MVIHIHIYRENVKKVSNQKWTINIKSSSNYNSDTVHGRADIYGSFFVNGNDFLHKKSNEIGYRYVQALKEKKMSEIVKCTKIARVKYNN